MLVSTTGRSFVAEIVEYAWWVSLVLRGLRGKSLAVATLGPGSTRSHFGLWRNDRSRKAAANIVSKFDPTVDNLIDRNFDWIDIRPDEFYDFPRQNLVRLYQRFRSLAAH
jgi:hypothetical protein